MINVRHFVTAVLFLCAGQLFAEAPANAVVGEVPVLSQKKVLVVYYSRTGNTKRMAEDVAKALNADIEQLIDKKDRSGAGGYLKAGMDATKGKPADLEPIKNDPSQYDLVVLGTPIWSWTMTPAIRAYVTDHKASLKDIAVFTTSGGSSPDKTVKKIEELYGKKAVAFTGVYASELKEKKRAIYDAKIAAFTAGLK